MVINNFDTMVSVIANMESDKKKSKEEKISKLITDYTNNRVTSAIDNSWSWARNVFRHAEKHRTEQLKKHILEFDEDNGCLNLVEFTRFFASVIEELKTWIDRDATAADCVEDVIDFMWTKIGAVKIDRRIIFTND